MTTLRYWNGSAYVAVPTQGPQGPAGPVGPQGPQGNVGPTAVTAVGATAPVVSSGGTTPTISMPAATNSVAGHLTAADRTTFAAKEPPIATGTTAQFWRGDKTFVAPAKADVGLGNVDNTSDANKPVSTAQAAADALRVLKAGDTMTGQLTLPVTAPVGDNDAVTKAYADKWDGIGKPFFDLTFDTSAIVAPPATGGVRMNASDQTLATTIWVSDTNYGGQGVSNLLDFVVGGDKLYLQDRLDPSRWRRYAVSAVSDAGAYHVFSVTYEAGGVQLVAGRILAMTDRASGSGGGGSDPTKLPLTGGTLTGDLTVSKTNPVITVNRAGGADTCFYSFKSGGVTRWNFLCDGSESGSNQGGDYAIARYADGGGWIDNPLSITRVDGTVTIRDALISTGPTTLAGKATTAAPTTGGAGFNLPHGTAPAAPVDGDLWTTASGMFARINSVTVGPFGAGGGGSDPTKLPLAGGTMTGKLTTLASATANAGLNLPHGSNPSPFTNGDLWTEATGLMVRINGTTWGPLVAPNVYNVWTSRQSMVASTTATAGFTLPHGAAPTTPNDGDLWTTSTGLYARISGATVGPMGSGGSGLPTTGGTMTGKITTAASATGGAGLTLPHGAAPTSPVNGDLWTTTAGIYGRINGATVGPLGSGGSGLPTTGGTLTGDLTISKTDPSLFIQRAGSADSAAIFLRTGTANRFAFVVDSTESGSNQGGDFSLARYSDAGSFINSPFSINRGTGVISLRGDVGFANNITVTGKVTTAASATGGAGLTLPHGAAPTTPVNGDIWTTTAGLFVRVNGATVGALTCDYRTKQDIGHLASTWDQVRELHPVSFTRANYEHVEEDGVERWGFLAHELQDTLLPSAATGEKDGPVVQSPDLLTIIAALTRTVQELQDRVEELEARG